MMHIFSKGQARLVVAAAAITVAASQARADYVQTNLVSDLPGLATITDPELVNPWGLSRLNASPIWASNQGKNDTTLYRIIGPTQVSKVVINPPIGFVSIPPTASGPPQGPTGQVANNNANTFKLANNQNARFMFADLNGQIYAWNGGLAATPKVTTSGAVYTGLAISAGEDRLFAAD